MEDDLHCLRIDGTSFCVKVLLSDSIGEVKRKIQESRGIPISSQILMFPSEFLTDDDQLLKSESIMNAKGTKYVFFDDGTSCTVAADVATPPPPVQINLKVTAAWEMTVSMGGGETIRQLKEKIGEKEGTPIDRITVIAGGNGIPVADETSVDECDISDLRVEISRFAQPLRVTLVYRSKRTREDGTVKVVGYQNPVVVNGEDTVSKLRLKIQEMPAHFNYMHPTEYYLTHKFGEMNEEKSFLENGVIDGDKIEITEAKPNADQDVIVLDP